MSIQTVKSVRKVLSIAGVTLAIGVIGCKSERPNDYQRQRPEIGSITDGDRGLQSKEIVDASDQMAQSLLSLPELNASDHRWLIVVDRVENRTMSNARQDLDTFLIRLKGNIAKYGRGRVQLIENRDRLRELQSRELEQGGDRFGQGGGAGAPGPAGIQPDFSLSAIARDLPNRSTTYYQFEFTLTDLHTRELVWNNIYEVRTAR